MKFLLVLCLSCCGISAIKALPTAATTTTTTLEPYDIAPGPHLHPPEEKHILPPNSSFRLRCSGEAPLEWSFDKTNYPRTVLPIDNRTTVTYEYIEGDSPRPYVSHLTIEELHYLDTGHFTCRHKGTEDDSDPMTAVGTHLYVSDPGHLFDEVSLYHWVNAPKYQETVIPCRPTDPEKVDMRFLKGATEDITDNLSDYFYEYDTERGLVITRGMAEFHQGMIVCQATRGDRQEKLSAILNFQKIEVLSPPYLIPPKSDNIYQGDNITFQCELPMEPSMPHMELVFGLPNGLNAKEDDRVVLGEPQRIRTLPDSLDYKMGKNVKITKTLTIHRVQQSDAGMYSCRSVVFKGRQESPQAKYYLRNILSHPNAPFIGVPHFNPEATIAMTEGEREAKWVFQLEANPDPEFIWYHPTGVEVDHATLDKYVQDINVTEDEMKLFIKDPELEDTGEYQFEVEVRDLEGESIKKNFTLTLEFLQSPLISMGANSLLVDVDSENVEVDFYFPGKAYELNCSIQGYPIDNSSISITFNECSSYSNCSEEAVEIESDSIEPDDGNLGSVHYSFVAKATIVPEKSGYYTCKVCTLPYEVLHIDGVCNETSMDFFLIEPKFAGGFQVMLTEEDDSVAQRPTGNSAIVVERDNVSLTCGASIYEYDRVDWYRYLNGTSGDKRTETERVSEKKLERGGNNFSHVATIKLGQVRMEDDGTYLCMATPSDEVEEVKETNMSHTLKVQEIIEPRRMYGNNMNNTDVAVEAGARLVLNCLVEGRPKPEVTWLKDDRVITDEFVENRTSLEFTDDNQVLTIVFALVNDSGVYSCEAINRGGTFLGELVVSVEAENTVPKALIGGMTALGLVLVCVGVYLVWKVRIYNRKYKELTKAELDLFVAGDPTAINPDLGVDDQAELLPYNREYEFPREKLKLDRQLGSGAFGRVVKAQATGISTQERCTTVAVKMVKPHADITYIKALMAELKIMIHLGKHLNIVNLLGACTTSLNKRELYVIVEYCRFGNIQKYLLLHRSNYIDQIDRETGEIDFTIGGDDLNMDSDELARMREEDEMSAVYGNRNLTGLTTATDGLGNTLNSQHPSFNNNGNGSVNGNGMLRPPRQTSVRYTTDPAEMARNRARKITTTSDYNDGLDQIVTTDMTMLAEEDMTGGGGSNKKPKRSLSNVSSQGPGWRANMRGDYDEQVVRPICTKDLICWAYQVARGMEYLASKKVMHGDLACRNILLAADNVVKICDFGLAKDIYKSNTYRKRSDGPLPIKWMAIESLRDQIFSTQSDVWAFGIVLWEMFSLGKNPYPGIQAADVYSYLLSERRMEKPDYCPRLIYRTMMHCWNADPSQRPNFSELMSGLEELLEDGEKDNYLNLNEQFNKHHRVNAVENRNYLAMMSSPDYNQQMSVSCDAGAPQEELLEEDVDEYLVPTSSRKNTATSVSNLPTSEEGYLLPQELQRKVSQQQSLSTVDECGYLMPNKNSESIPMLTHKDDTNIVEDNAIQEGVV